MIDAKLESELKVFAGYARSTVETLHHQTNALGHFPIKCGDYATQYLMIALADHGYRNFVTMESLDPYSADQVHPYIHRWAEWEGFVIDLTADQFTDHFSDIVCGLSGWHKGLTGKVNSTLTGDYEKHCLERDGLLHHLDLFRDLWPVKYPS